MRLILQIYQTRRPEHLATIRTPGSPRRNDNPEQNHRDAEDSP